MSWLVSLLPRIGRASTDAVSSGLSRAASTMSINQDLISLASAAETSRSGSQAVAVGKKALKYGTIAFVGHEAGNTFESMTAKQQNDPYLSLNQALELANSQKPTVYAGLDKYGCGNTTVLQYLDCLSQAKNMELIWIMGIFMLLFTILILVVIIILMAINGRGCFRRCNVSTSAQINSSGINLQTFSNVTSPANNSETTPAKLNEPWSA